MEIQGLKDDAANMIVDAVNFANLAAIHATDCGVNLSASLYLNIRDAMFHFRALCDCSEDDTNNILKQYFNLKEHLLRGEKDAIICQVQSIHTALYAIMQLKSFHDIFNADEIRQFQRLSHELKDIVLRLRMDGSQLSQKTAFSPLEAWSEVYTYTLKIIQLCRSKNISLF